MRRRQLHRRRWTRYKMRQELKFTVSREAENLHREPLVVPCDTERLYIKVDLPEEFRYMSFLILEDPEGHIRLQKQLAWGDQGLCVGKGPKDTTIGGVPGRIQPGTWQVCLGIFTEYLHQRLGDKRGCITMTVSDGEGPVSDPMGGLAWVEDTLEISPEKYHWDKVYGTKKQWYKGDFHTHTRLSDGKEPLENAMKKAVDMDMDFYVPTEHNLMHTGLCDTSLCILPGIEVTTDKGHMNLFGITKLPERILDIVAHNGEEIVDSYMEETIREARENHWITSINHPFLTIWKWRYDQTDLDDIDCLEIINDPTYTDAKDSNEKAVRFLDALWQDGHRIYGVGGSDSHNLIEERYEGADLPSIPGDPATWVCCGELTPDNLMAAVKAGHMCVTRFCRMTPVIHGAGRTFLPGDELPEDVDRVTIQVLIEGLAEKPVVSLVRNGASREPEVRELEVRELEGGKWEVLADAELEEEKWQWLRLDVRSREKEFLGYMNPVFRGSANSRYRTFGEIKKTMEEL